jgi:hypothetical protein
MFALFAFGYLFGFVGLCRGTARRRHRRADTVCVLSVLCKPTIRSRGSRYPVARDWQSGKSGRITLVPRAHAIIGNAPPLWLSRWYARSGLRLRRSDRSTNLRAGRVG